VVESAVSQRDWFGQPRGLTVLFLTEMWDQFSFYGMRSLLVLYMTKHLMIEQQAASWIYGLYAAFFYLMPVFGGMLADRWLGRRVSVLIGGTIMAAGHFMMSFESLFYWALVTIALGNGLFLPSLPSQIDSLYAPDDPRRKSAYNVYYVGVNLGALAAPLVIGTVGEIYGFHYGFAIAGLGMIVAMTTYVAGGRYLPPDLPRTSDTQSLFSADSTVFTGDFLKRVSLLVLIAGAVVVFRGAYEQFGNTISLWADGSVDRRISSGTKIPVTWFLSLNSLLVFALTPLLVLHWTRLARRHRELSTVAKMVWGAIAVALAYLMIGAVCFWAQGHSEDVTWPWLAGFVTLLTAGELYILPVGLGLFGRLAPKGLTATTIAMWFSAGFLGNLFAGWLGTFWSRLGHGAFFTLIAAVALMAAFFLIFLISRAKELENGRAWAGAS